MPDPPPRRVNFPLGQTVATPGVLKAVPEETIHQCLVRHAHGDWGDVCKEDWHFNEQALKRGSRIISVYNADNGTKFWIITEAETEPGVRASTCVLLGEEY